MRYKIRWLRDLGFDKSCWVKRGQYHVQCSQCQSMVVSNVPLHERGCPNQNKRRKVEDE